MKGFETYCNENSGNYEVVYQDRNYKIVRKVFKNDPQGAPENARKKAQAYAAKLDKQDKADSYGLIRGKININHIG